MNLGIGVTAWSEEGATGLVRGVWATDAITDIRARKEIGELDQEHVAPNMGSSLRRGIRDCVAVSFACSTPVSNRPPETQMRCMMAASLRATASRARLAPRRRATVTPQARNFECSRPRVINANAAS